MHASLAAPGSPAPGHRHDEARAGAGAQAPGGHKAGGERQQRSDAWATLLAALALMTGIALRRWGEGPQ